MNNPVKLKALANAKINLHLEVLGKRPDGYHDISTIFQSVDLADEISLTLSDGEGVSVTTENMVIEGENLAKKAADLFLDFCGKKARIEILIKKNIPLIAGLAGGSADAAAVLVLLNKALDFPLSQSELLHLGAKLGADVPFCIEGGTALAQGIGEKLSPINSVDDFWVILIKHYKKSSTGAMYGRLDNREIIPSPCTEVIIKALSQNDYATTSPLIKNSFLDVSDYKDEQTSIINELLSGGAVLAGLSGSGPTVFGLFKSVSDEFLNELNNKYNEVCLCRTSHRGIKIVE